eukprot:m.226185 g.226185  ORF g.226185 m.226185 type:complete len:155 (+) comp15164_c0_seq10:369-833(+)
MEPRDDSDKGRMKAAVHFAVGKILTRTQNDEQVRFSKATIATVTELLMNQVESMAQDLEAFAQHAKRSTVSPDDVLLLARRRGALLESLKKTKAALQKPRGGKRKASLHTAASAATVEGQDPQDEDHDTGAPSPKEQPNAVSEAHLQVDDSLSS